MSELYAQLEYGYNCMSSRHSLVTVHRAELDRGRLVKRTDAYALYHREGGPFVHIYRGKVRLNSVSFPSTSDDHGIAQFATPIMEVFETLNNDPQYNQGQKLLAVPQLEEILKQAA